MNESDYNSQIEKIAKLMEQDNVSPDEQDPKSLKNTMICKKQIFN